MKNIQLYERLKSRTTVSAEGCWIWCGSKSEFGYGRVGVDGKNRNAHRKMWEAVHGTLASADIKVCHKCDIRDCINPDHLFTGSQSQNMRDCASKGRRGRRLSEESVLSILEMSKSKTLQKDIAKSFGVSRSTISNIVCGVFWQTERIKKSRGR